MRRSYSDETKAAAMAALLTGVATRWVAREMAIPRGTVRRWAAKAREMAQDAPLKKGSQGVSTRLYDLVVAALQATTAQVRVPSDPQWVARQRALPMALLHGQQFDRTLRVVEQIGE